MNECKELEILFYHNNVTMSISCRIGILSSLHEPVGPWNCQLKGACIRAMFLMVCRPPVGGMYTSNVSNGL